MPDLHLAYVLIVSALAAGRIAVILVHDFILDKPRTWFFRHVPPMDNLMEGYDYQSKDKDGNPLPASLKRDWHMIAELFTCTRCLTVWATGATFAIAATSDIGLTAMEVIAAMGIAAWFAAKLH